MLNTGKISSILYMIVLQCWLINQGVLFAEALVRNESKEKIKHPNQLEIQNNRPSSILSMNEGTSKLPEEHIHHYYLPEQTLFGSPHLRDLSSSVLLTSPPRLTIDPTPVQQGDVNNPSTYASSEYLHPAEVKVLESVTKVQRQYNCISETPTLDIGSESLFPSESLKKDIMSGRVETASKTETEEETSNFIISHPSVLVQGTKVNIRRHPSVPVILSI